MKSLHRSRYSWSRVESTYPARQKRSWLKLDCISGLESTTMLNIKHSSFCHNSLLSCKELVLETAFSVCLNLLVRRFWMMRPFLRFSFFSLLKVGWTEPKKVKIVCFRPFWILKKYNLFQTWLLEKKQNNAKSDGIWGLLVFFCLCKQAFFLDIRKQNTTKEKGFCILQYITYFNWESKLM